MDIVFNLHGQTYYIDTAVITPFSANAGLISAASARPGYMAKREEKKKFDRTSRINLIPFILETTRRPGYHAQKFIKHLFSDTDLGCYPNHTTQLHLQTTTPGGHHVTALSTDSPPSSHHSVNTPSLKSTHDPCSSPSYTPVSAGSIPAVQFTLCYAAMFRICPIARCWLLQLAPERPKGHRSRSPTAKPKVDATTSATDSNATAGTQETPSPTASTASAGGLLAIPPPPARPARWELPVGPPGRRGSAPLIEPLVSQTFLRSQSRLR